MKGPGRVISLRAALAAGRLAWLGQADRPAGNLRRNR